MSAPIPQAAFQNGADGRASVKRVGRPVKYPVADLGVGEWLDLPLTGCMARQGRDRAVFSLKDAADRLTRLQGKRFSVRTLRKDGVARCTRIA
jgi:hypothetical protein